MYPFHINVLAGGTSVKGTSHLTHLPLFRFASAVPLKVYDPPFRIHVQICLKVAKISNKTSRNS